MSSSSAPRPRGAAAKTSSVTSPLAQAPTFSPPSHPLAASPLRRSFNSDATTDASSNHRHSGSTIRIVNDPGNDVYDKFPLPSEPSQILPPPRNAPGYAFETPAARVSSGSRVANAIARFESARSPPAQPPVQRQKGSVRHSLATNASEEDTLVGTSLSRSSLRYSQNSTPRSSLPPPEFQDFETDLDVLEEEASTLTLRPTIRPVPPSSSGGDTVKSAPRALSSQASDASLVSATPTGSPAQYVHVDRDTSRISRPISKVPNYTFASELEGGPSAFSGSFSHRPPVLKPSTESFAYSNISSTSIEPEEPSPTPSPPTNAGSRLAYSSARSPSDYSLAESQNTPTYVSRMLDRGLAHTWSSQLSTIASVSERDSRSYGRSSTPMFRARSHSQDSYGGQERIQMPRRRGQTVGSTYSSDNMSSDPSESALPLPLFSPGQSPQEHIFDEKHEDEDLDTISPLPSSVPLRMKNSGYLRRQSSDTSLNSSRPNSSHSDISTFNRNIIPAWARCAFTPSSRILSANMCAGHTISVARGYQSSQASRNRLAAFDWDPRTAGDRTHPRNDTSQEVSTGRVTDPTALPTQIPCPCRSPTSTSSTTRLIWLELMDTL